MAGKPSKDGNFSSGIAAGCEPRGLRSALPGSWRVPALAIRLAGLVLAKVALHAARFSALDHVYVSVLTLDGLG